MRTLVMEGYRSAVTVAALMTLAWCLAGAFIRQARTHDFEVSQQMACWFRLYGLLADTYLGHLSPEDWDVDYYLARVKQPAVRRALEFLAK